MTIPLNLSPKEALQAILKICYESSEYSRRTQAIHETAMIALGFTFEQRQTRHVKAMMRSEEYKESIKAVGTGEAKRQFKQACEDDTGEKRMSYKNHLVKG